jgi:hypothetical protein
MGSENLQTAGVKSVETQGDYVTCHNELDCEGGRGKKKRKLFESPVEEFAPEVLSLLICYTHRNGCFVCMMPLLLKSSYYNLGHRSPIPSLF